MVAPKEDKGIYTQEPAEGTAEEKSNASSKQNDTLTLEAAKHMAIRHAAAVAAASIEKKLASTASTCETVHLTRQLTELQRCSLQSELGFLDVLVKMTNEQKLQSLFLLFDTDGSGSVSSQEMARCLKKMDTGKTFSESLDAAVLSIQAFDVDDDGAMDIHEFADFVEDLVMSLRCNFDDLAQFLTLRVAFADSGSSVLDEAIVALVHDSTAAGANSNNSGGGVSSVEDFNDAVVEVRMMLLFQMMDWRGQGHVCFEDVVKSLYHVTRHMDEIPRKALLMCAESGEQRSLDYPQFSSLLLNVVAAGSLNFHDVANSMTLAHCKNDVTHTDLSDLFVDDKVYRNAIAEQQKRGGVINPDSEEILDALQYGRLNRLFDLWDLDHSGELDFSEFVLGMRKFHEAKEVDKTVEETVATMLSFDENNDQKLDRKEFATLLAQFAKSARVPLHELIDFMVVTSAVKDNSDVEKAYIDSVKSRASDQIKQQQQQQQNHNGEHRSLGSLWRNLRGDDKEKH